MLKNYFLSLAFVLVSLTSKAQTVLEYNVGGAATGADYISNGLNLDFNAITTCQTAVSAVFSSGGYNGTWSNGSFNYYVNGTLVGSGVGSATVDLSAYIPVQSVRIQKTNYDNWNTVSIKLNVTSNTGSLPSLPQAVSDVYYLQNSTASPLNATLTGTGTALKWYVSALGEGYSTTAPTPVTSTLGTTSYWVSQVDASGCESARKQVNVHVTNVLPGTHLDFDGANDYVNCGNAPALQISGNAITLEARVKFTSFAGSSDNGSIINKEQNSPDYGYMLRAGGSGVVSFNLGNGWWNELSSPSNAVTLGVWHHIAATYEGTTMKIYVDGVEVASQGLTNINFSSTNQNLMIGSWSNIGRYLNASVDEVRVWNIARTTAEIQNAMNCELNNPTSQTGLVAYYQFNQGVDGADNTALTTLTDSSATAYTATLNNFALNGTASNWLAGSSVVTGNICATLSSDGFESDSFAVKVYPNPSSGVFQLQNQEAAQLEVYDLMGKVILNKSVQAGDVSFDLSGYAPGVYLLKITNNSGNTTVSKIVKK